MLPPLRPSNVRPLIIAKSTTGATVRREQSAEILSIRPSRVAIKAQPVKLKAPLAILDDDEE